MNYNPQTIEKKRQKLWCKSHSFCLSNNLSNLKKRPKYYVLDMFPYPSGSGLHVGHPKGYTATDVIARFKRMNGFNVLHPMGWDSFGLPAERTAMREALDPRIITDRNIQIFKMQIKRLGLSYDWDREIDTSDPRYYKWTQWIFLKLYKRKLAYLENVPVNFCPALSTVLANEEIFNGRYIETGDIVEIKEMKQWMLRISLYAERLLNDLSELDWPEHVKSMQRNWIGRVEGINLEFKILPLNCKVKIFLNSSEIIYGITYLALSMKNKLINELIDKKYYKEADYYIANNQHEERRRNQKDSQSGIFTGFYALHPLTSQKIPVWIASYESLDSIDAVGAIPGHNIHDCNFALQYKIPIISVLENHNNQIFFNKKRECNITNSCEINKKNGLRGQTLSNNFIIKEGIGKKHINYRLQDWLFSRQRYWGEPFPIVFDDTNKPIPLPESELPVILPLVNQNKGSIEHIPLNRASNSWLNINVNGINCRREVNTMPQWAGSCWYYLRYIDPKNNKEMVNKSLERYFMPVDLYIGGIEHAVLHLLYSRFWHKVLYDCGLVSTKEPFLKLFNQGMILRKSFRDYSGKYYKYSEIKKKNNLYYNKKDLKLIVTMEKMSKSKYNTINPDVVINNYGADSMRIYELFMGPLGQNNIWSMKGVAGVFRFLNRIWRLFIDESTGKINKIISLKDCINNSSIIDLFNKVIKKVTVDTNALKFNTAIASMMEFINVISLFNVLHRPVLLDFLKILYPYAPHISEELWFILSKKNLEFSSVKWPTYIKRPQGELGVFLAIQLNGKIKHKVRVAKKICGEKLENIAINNLNNFKYFDKKNIEKIFIIQRDG